MGAEDMLDRALAPPAPGRTWDLTDTGTRPLTMNEFRRLHYHVWSARCADTRKLWADLTRKARVPRLQRARITVTPLHRDARSPQDVAACCPEAKAAVDGIIDASVLPDDDPTHLLAITFLQPDVCGHNGMRIRIEEAP